MGPRLYALTFSVVATVLIGPASAARELSFDDRVEAQRAIERVYYGNQQGVTRSFDAAITRDLLERKVSTYLEQSAALAAYWRTPVTAVSLRRETERMIRETRLPDRLQSIFAALGHDSFLIQECLVRPVLAQRLATGFFAQDERIHADARREMERLRAKLIEGSIDARAEHARRTLIEYVLDDVPPIDPAVRKISLTVEEMRQIRNELPGHVDEVGPIEEGRLELSVSVVLEIGSDRLRVSRFALPKSSWDEWWTANRGRFRGLPVPPVAESSLDVTRSGTEGSPCLRDDSWDSRLYAPRYLDQSLFVWTGSEMLLWSTEDNPGLPFNLASYDPATDSWSRLSSVGAPAGLDYATAVWSGTEMIVWGGSSRSGGSVDTGARYDPASDSWTPTTLVGAPAPRYRHSAVWTGSEMIVWGGINLATGSRYDPLTDSWKEMSLDEAPSGRRDHAAVWTGDRMIVWGGRRSTPPYPEFPEDGAVYDPVSDNWTPMPTDDPDAPAPRPEPTAAWSGTEMIVWGGPNDDTGGRFDPIQNDWTTISTLNAPIAQQAPRSVWAGSELLVSGGVGPGKRYDPQLDVWTDMSTLNAPSSVYPAVWADGLMLLADGWRYDPVADFWTGSFLSNSPAARREHSVSWTGNELIVWGGRYTPSTGGRYDPGLHNWTLIENVSVISEEYHAAVWTGDELIITGGWASSFLFGFRYDPLANDWSAASFSGQPTLRRKHSAIWTGTEMIVWGGEALGIDALGTGSRYDPVADSWTPTTMTGAPSARTEQKAVWTGTEMIVWGGEDPVIGNLQTGARYDPASDSWTPTSLVGAPGARIDHSLFWTGSEMLVWGGTTWTGGRYDPASDSWTPVSLVGAPAPRTSHFGEWISERMVVWGGYDDGWVVTGGRYDPARDSWEETSIQDAPDGRSVADTAAADDRMYIWGGSTALQDFRSGAAYLFGVEADLDGDGIGECSGDCDDLDPTRYPGAAELCDLVDNDCNTIVDDNAAPPEVAGLQFAPDIDTLTWQAAPPGLGTVYDVARGRVAEFPVGAGAAETCLSSGTGLSAPAFESPALDEAYWYLVRSRNDCGAGGYGTETDATERVTTVCP